MDMNTIAQKVINIQEQIFHAKEARTDVYIIEDKNVIFVREFDPLENAHILLQIPYYVLLSNDNITINF